MYKQTKIILHVFQKISLQFGVEQADRFIKRHQVKDLKFLSTVSPCTITYLVQLIYSIHKWFDLEEISHTNSSTNICCQLKSAIFINKFSKGVCFFSIVKNICYSTMNHYIMNIPNPLSMTQSFSLFKWRARSMLEYYFLSTAKNYYLKSKHVTGSQAHVQCIFIEKICSEYVFCSHAVGTDDPLFIYTNFFRA